LWSAVRVRELPEDASADGRLAHLLEACGLVFENRTVSL
jgi:hypothetical protein